MPTPISQSGLWKIQRDYYQHLGMAAWDDKTPYYITNSQLIVESYAELVMAFLLDHAVDPAHPLYLLELGSGTGRFGYHLVRELRRKFSFFPALQALNFTLILSDIVESNVEFWQQHPRLAELGSSVDFALMAPGAENQVWMRRAGKKLEPVANPLVVIANYLFDSLPHDEFRISPKEVEECLIDIVPRSERPHSSAERLDARDVDLVRSYRTIDVDSYYTEPQLREVLRHYRAHLKEGCVTIPVAALDCVERLRQLGPLVLLSSDRGFTDPERMAVYPDHPWALHEGCFSHMVNYHALSLSFTCRLATRRHMIDGVQTVCFSDLPEGLNLNYAFRERLERSNALNNANELFGLVRDRPPFKGLIGFIKLNLHDPNAFAVVAKRLSENVQRLSYDEHCEVVATLEGVWDNDFYFRGSPNVTFWLAHIYATLGLFEKALTFYDLTIERQGADAMLLYLKGSCWHALGHAKLARSLYQQALQRQPGMPEAVRALQSLG